MCRRAESSDLSIDMVGPNTSGVQRSEWMFMLNEGGLRGVGAQGETPLYVQIVVTGFPAPTLNQPVVLSQPIQQSDQAEAPAVTPTASALCVQHDPCITR